MTFPCFSFLLLVLLSLQIICRLEMNRKLGLDDGTIRDELGGLFASLASSCHVPLLFCCCSCYCCCRINLFDCWVDSDAVSGSNDDIGIQYLGPVTALGMLSSLLLLLSLSSSLSLFCSVWNVAATCVSAIDILLRPFPSVCHDLTHVAKPS